MLQIINSAAQRYQGVIPSDCWHEPYMSAEELTGEIARGVEFWGAEIGDELVGVMGVQQSLDVDLIRHAYVRPSAQGQGIGGLLLKKLCDESLRPILIGTWAAAQWAIKFYEHYGFYVAESDEARTLLKKYWSVPDRQIETSVVLKRG